jgi:hypothetical protein
VLAFSCDSFRDRAIDISFLLGYNLIGSFFPESSFYLVARPCAGQWLPARFAFTCFAAHDDSSARRPPSENHVPSHALALALLIQEL